ncbi:MAG: endonuclease III [Candidatus Lambdaproteobacteria bacterium]|nr:endonuclease III [Candidatus Lambdaproteobacteria bacterium]
MAASPATKRRRVAQHPVRPARGRAASRRSPAPRGSTAARQNTAPRQAAAPRSRDAAGTRLTPAQAERMFARLAEAIPAPRSELAFQTPFELLVAVILSAQATDRSVNLATGPLFARHNTPAALLALGEAGLLGYIRTIGLAPTKARNLIATARLLMERHGGEVPRSREALEALPGVGRKTANVVLNVAFGEPTIAVDTHVFRVANRTGLAPGATVLAVEEGLLAITPPAHRRHAHHYLILHGRYVCRARKPDCPNCVLADLCPYPDKTSA